MHRIKNQDDLNFFIDLVPDGTIIINPEGEILLINTKAEELFGYTGTELIGKNLDKIIPQRFRQVHKKHIVGYINQPTYRGMGHLITELFGLKKDGTEFPVDISLGGLTIGGNKVAVASIRDITERKKAKQQLRESEEKYRNLIEGSQELIQSIGQHGQLEFVNAAWKNTMGYNDEEIKTLNVFDIIAPESKESCTEEFERIMRGEMLKNVEAVFTSKSGTKIYVEGTSIPKFENGVVVGTQGFYRNVTDQKKTEANFVSVLQNSTIGYLFLDTEYKIITFNETFNKWVQHETENNLVLKENYLSLLDKDRRVRTEILFQKILNGKSINYETVGKGESNKKWYYVSLSPIFNSENEVLGISCTCFDITDKKNAETERQEIVNEIVSRNTDLEQFAFMIAHNLRAPLSNITGAAQVLKHEGITEYDKTTLIDGIYTSALKFDAVLDDLNNILKIKKNINEAKQTLQLNQVFEDVKETLAQLLSVNGVNFIINFDEVPVIDTLNSYMYSIFYNLISNSIKYQQPQTELLIEIYSKKIENGYQLIFKDNGKGIDLVKYSTKIFKLYSRFDTVIEGKGIGLFMVKTQVESLGGKIEIESAVNEGAVFTLTFTNPKN